MDKPNSSLSQFIEEYPLYVKFGIDQPAEIADLSNLAFNFFCGEEKEVQPFRLSVGLPAAIEPMHNGSPLETGKTSFTEIFTGICRSCESYKIKIVINAAVQKESPKYFLRKIGQFPAPDLTGARLPDELSYFLHDESRSFYIKALKNLDMECGSGALSYFLRVIRNEMERIVEIMANPLTHGSHQIAELYASYKQSGIRSKFIEEVTPLLPKSLHEHGANIIVVLHDTLSVTIPDLSEHDSLKKAKDIDSLFRYLVKRIQVEINDPFFGKGPDKYFLRHS